MALMAGDHSDNEDWRRQRAEQLRLHDAGPFATRPARERQPVVDSVEPMQRPVPPVPPIATAPEPTPSRAEQQRGSEPPARRYRPQSPLVSGAAAAPITDAVPLAPRRPPEPASTARHPLVRGAGIAAALAGAGALGWMLRAEVDRVHTPVVTRVAPVAVAPDVPGSPLSTVVDRGSIAGPVAPTPPRTPAASPPIAQTALSQASQADPKRSLAPVSGLPGPAQPSRDARPLQATTPEARAVETPAVLADKTPAPKPVSDSTSRFAHPAKAVALPGRDFSPSFDCRRAMSAVNRAICASPELSAFDRQMSQTFYRVTASVDLERHKAIDRDQVEFLNERARCTSDDCVAGVYRRRLDALRVDGSGD